MLVMQFGLLKRDAVKCNLAPVSYIRSFAYPMVRMSGLENAYVNLFTLIDTSCTVGIL